MAPINGGVAPEAEVMENVLAQKDERVPRGSLNNFRVSSPLLRMVATTEKLSTWLTWGGPEILSESPGVAATEVAARRRAEAVVSIIAKVSYLLAGAEGTG